MIDDAALRAMSAEQRREIRRRITDIDGVEPGMTLERSRYRIGQVAYSVIPLAMAAWIALLATTLPDRYQADQWRVTWVGFDIVLTVLLVAMGWSGLHLRHILIPLMIVIATLLCCDAWFDLTLSAGSAEEWVSILTAVCAEIPLAIAIFLRARKMILATARATARALGNPDPTALYRLPLLIEVIDIPASNTTEPNQPEN
ncbi:hypothetical protein ACIRRA_21250 [Nocardia sp. NPDC101769]|uniref:hypothetical protein n=1 Tax=Nocardia sp. NPDC101769 TaxID=3364333 RepID=UPI003810E0E1